jgi:DNA polymerase-3 subunit delta
MDSSRLPIYVLIGDDPYLRDQARNRIIRDLIGQADPQTCVSSHDADAALADVLDDLRTLAFLAEHRVVIVRQADPFVSKYRQQLEDYLARPAATGSLILEVASLPKNQRLYKAADKVGRIVHCKQPTGRDLIAWIRDEAERRGKKIQPQAASMLADWAGADLAQLSGELEKLATYVGKRDAIAPEDVAAVVPALAAAADFELTNALIAGDLSRALGALPAMLQARGDEFKALGILRWHLHKALAVAQGIAAGRRGEQVAAANKVPRFLTRDFAAMVQGRGLAGIQGDMRRLLAADLAMKTGAEPRAAMRDLVVGLCV